MSEATSSCNYEELEAGFCYAIDPSLLRDMRRSRIRADQVLETLIPLWTGGYLGAHLGKSPGGGKVRGSCFEHMTILVDQRMAAFDECLPDVRLLAYAAHYAGGDSHVRSCKYCKRDIGQLEGKLPDYNEFGLRIYS